MRKPDSRIVRRIAPWVVIGIAAGSLIHGYMPTDLVEQVGGRSNPLAVPLVVMLGVPLYANAAGTIPIVEALLGKGIPIGTVLAFMMAVTALPIPELLILRRVMRREAVPAPLTTTSSVRSAIGSRPSVKTISQSAPTSARSPLGMAYRFSDVMEPPSSTRWSR